MIDRPWGKPVSDLGEGAGVTWEGCAGGEGGRGGCARPEVRTPVAVQLTPMQEQDLMDTGLISPPRDFSIVDLHGVQQSGLVLSPVRLLSPGREPAGRLGSEGEDRASLRQSPGAKHLPGNEAVSVAEEAPEEARGGEVVLELGSRVQAVAVSGCGRYLTPESRSCPLDFHCTAGDQTQGEARTGGKVGTLRHCGLLRTTVAILNPIAGCVQLGE